MKLLDRYEFTNGRLFETYLLERQDTARYAVPECDVIGLRRVGDDNDLMSVMRPDEALIQARMLVDAVRKITGEYEIDDDGDSQGDSPSLPPLATELVKDLKEVDHAAVEEGR